MRTAAAKAGRMRYRLVGGNDMMLRAILALGAGATGAVCGLLLAEPLWAITRPLPMFWRYVAGAMVGVAGGLWIGDTALYLEAHLDG